MDLEAIRDNLLFRGMTGAELSDCVSALSARERQYPRGSLILRAGETTDCMGIVLTGSVTIESNDAWGGCTVLSHVGRGGFFAETYALLRQEAMLVDVRANEDSRILFLNLGGLAGAVHAPAPWQYKLTANLLLISAHKNLALTGRSFHTAPKTIRGRILSYLNAVSLQQHSAAFDIPFDRQQLADYLNVERTALSKELGKMRAEGLIRCRRNHFEILRN